MLELAGLKRILTADIAGQSRIRGHLQLLLQAIYAVVRDLSRGQLTLRSMSLSYSTLLSVVPLLAFSFALLKGLGAHNSLKPILDEFLAPMGSGGAELSDLIVSFVEHMNIAVLGSAGLLVLIFTVVSLVKKIEDSFNYIWNVRQGRTASERLRDYLSILLVGPVLMVSAAGISATLEQTELAQSLKALHPAGAMLVGLLTVIPKLLLFGAFTFLYSFIPNVRVAWRAAAMGALVAAALWLVAGWAFTSFVASSAKYTAIYSSFAVLILLLMWLNLNWLFVLMGANIAYYVQNPDHLLLQRGALRPSARSRERLALQAMLSIARDHRRGVVCWNGDRLGREFGVPRDVANLVLDDLVRSGLLVRTAGQLQDALLPGRASDQISVKDILLAVGAAGQDFAGKRPLDSAVSEVIDDLRRALDQTMAGRNLAEMVQAQEVAEGRAQTRVRTVPRAVIDAAAAPAEGGVRDA